MANVLFTTRKTVTDVLGMVSTSTSMVSHGLNSLAHLTEAASMHSAEYRDNTKAGIELNREANIMAAKQQAAIAAANKLRSVEIQLSEDPDLDVIYQKLMANKDPKLAPVPAQEAA